MTDLHKRAAEVERLCGFEILPQHADISAYLCVLTPNVVVRGKSSQDALAELADMLKLAANTRGKPCKFAWQSLPEILPPEPPETHWHARASVLVLHSRSE